jgi:hypothetical protein
MTFAEKLFNVLANARMRNGGVLEKSVWLALAQQTFEAEKPAAAKRKKSAAKMTDEEWIESLEREPALAGVSVRTELAKAQFWAKNNNRQCTRRFFVNWLGKAERTVTHPGGKSVVRTGDIYTEPEGWKTSERARSAVRVDAEVWANIVAEGWGNLSPDLRASILRSL